MNVHSDVWRRATARKIASALLRVDGPSFERLFALALTDLETVAVVWFPTREEAAA